MMYIRLRYICNACRFKTGNMDTYFISRKDGKIIETPYVLGMDYLKS